MHEKGPARLAGRLYADVTSGTGTPHLIGLPYSLPGRSRREGMGRMLAPGTGIGGWYSDVVLSNQASMTSNVEVTAAGRHSQL
jgi:hypothetical protein